MQNKTNYENIVNQVFDIFPKEYQPQNIIKLMT